MTKSITTKKLFPSNDITKHLLENLEKEIAKEEVYSTLITLSKQHPTSISPQMYHFISSDDLLKNFKLKVNFY